MPPKQRWGSSLNTRHLWITPTTPLLIQTPLKSHISTQLFTCWYLSLIIYKTVTNSSVCVCVCQWGFFVVFFCAPWTAILFIQVKIITRNYFWHSSGFYLKKQVQLTMGIGMVISVNTLLIIVTNMILNPFFIDPFFKT